MHSHVATQAKKYNLPKSKLAIASENARRPAKVAPVPRNARTDRRQQHKQREPTKPVVERQREQPSLSAQYRREFGGKPQAVQPDTEALTTLMQCAQIAQFVQQVQQAQQAQQAGDGDLQAVQTRIQQLKESVSVTAQHWMQNSPASYMETTQQSGHAPRLQEMGLWPQPPPQSDSVKSLLESLQIMQSSRAQSL